MDGKNKDKLIIGLIIAVVILLANSLVGGRSSELSATKLGLFDNSDDLLIETDENNQDDQEANLYEPIAEMKVHISGEVVRPGVYTVTEGDRLDDLIKKAGGLSDIANERNLNLAMKLEDQMKVYVPSIYEEDIELTDSLNLVTVAQSESQTDKININTASKEELMSLPNIGDKRAQAIIDYREENLFQSIEDIKNVTGIGDKFYQAMKDLITI